MEDIHKILKEFSDKYEGEVGVKGHNIPKLLERAKKKRDQKKIIEYEKQIQINNRLKEISDKYTNKESLNENDCNTLKEGIENWNKELEFWMNKWYIKPFVSKNELFRQRCFVKKLQETEKEVCKIPKKE